jgi:hypothetical protein
MKVVESDLDIGSRAAHHLPCVELDKVVPHKGLSGRPKKLGGAKTLASLLTKSHNREKAKAHSRKANTQKDEKKTKLVKKQPGGDARSDALTAFTASLPNSKTLRPGQRMYITQSTNEPENVLEFLIQERQEEVWQWQY